MINVRFPTTVRPRITFTRPGNLHHVYIPCCSIKVQLYSSSLNILRGLLNSYRSHTAYVTLLYTTLLNLIVNSSLNILRGLINYYRSHTA